MKKLEMSDDDSVHESFLKMTRVSATKLEVSDYKSVTKPRT